MKQVVLAVELAPRHLRGLRLANPVMWASGTFGADGYGALLPRAFPLHRLGAVVAKTTTLTPRHGNPTPRVYHHQGWTINSIGLHNPGIEAVLREKAPLWASWPVPVLLSLGGERIEEFGKLAALADGVAGIAALEINISCPNVEGGLNFGQDPQAAAEVTRLVKGVTSLPIIVKLTPNVTDIVAIAQRVAEAGADALCLTNTLTGMKIDVKRQKPLLGGVLGGLSGPALKPVALAMVYQVAQAVDIPIVGVGGIATAEDALEFIMAGATAVQVGTASLANAQAPLEVLDGLTAYLKYQGIQNLSTLVGAAHLEQQTSRWPPGSAKRSTTS